MIDVKNLCKNYGSLKAVDNISFSVDEGEIVGFLGPNGAGKTSTIRILTCYHPATSGKASVGGFDVFADSMQVRRMMGYLPEATPLYPEMRVREYLQFRGKLHGLDRGERASAISRVTDRCWLGEFVNRPIGHLSKGMKQRVGLADAMLCDPKVLVLDEPTIGLDPTQIRETRNLIKQLGEHHTILFSSHILSEVEQTCSKIILIAKGKVLAQGSPSELREKVSADSKIFAEVKGPTKEIQTAIDSIEGTRSVELDGAPTGDWNRFIITGNGQRDIREPVARVIQDKGWGLRELRREVASLEDFFVKIIAEQKN
ncbi:MAG: multidrug ABC transporter ATP-binding protein [Phycisphaerae bacterium]|nr:MAG: multidrug ABC transporter ATP-binding protein [Phycisphaerae bacterium]